MSHTLYYKVISSFDFKRFQQKCLDIDKSISSVCLNFVYSHKEISNVIIGIQSLDELITNFNDVKDKNINLKEFNTSEFNINDEDILLPYNWK